MARPQARSHPAHGAPARERFALLALAVAVAAALVGHWNALGAELLFDSVPVVRDDPRVTTLGWAQLRDVLLDDYWYGLDGNLYRPLTTLSYALNHALVGSAAVGFVAVNLALHALNACLVALLARRLGLARRTALFAAILFAVHPLGTEAVANAVGRADLLAATGVLAGVLLHARVAAGASGGWRSRLGLVAASALAIGAKESGVVLIGAVVLWDLVPALARGPVEWRARALGSYLWIALPLVPYFVLRQVAFEGGASPPSPVDNPLLLADPLAARATASGVLLRYLGLVVWPARLSADHSFEAVPVFAFGASTLDDWIVWLSAPLLVGAVVAAVLVRRRRPAVAFAVLWFFVTIAPVSNVFLLVGTIMGERLVYLPLVGPLVLAAVAGASLLARVPAPRRTAVGGAAAAVLLGALAWRSSERNADWHSGVALFESAVAVRPESFKAHESLAGELYLAHRDDEPALRAHVDAIVEHAERAWEILRRLPPSVGYGDLLADLGVYDRVQASLHPAGDERAQWLERSLALYDAALAYEAAAPERAPNWRLRRGRAEALQSLGRAEEALEAYGAALALAPGPELLVPYARLAASAGREALAFELSLRAITLVPAAEPCWQIVAAHYTRTRPGERTVVRDQAGRWLFDTTNPAVVADLERAVRAQYEALGALGSGRDAEAYRRGTTASLGIDPLAGGR